MKEKTNMIVALGLVAAIIILALNAKAPDVNISSAPGEMRETISVSGTGLISVEPDEAEVYINIITEGGNAADVQADNADTAAAVRNALKNKGVRDDDIETSGYYLYPQSAWDSDTGESRIYGYKLTHRLKITTKDTDNTGKLVDAAVAAGANSLDTVNFRLSDEMSRRTYEDALKLASVNAKGKADSIASALGVRIGDIASVSESGAYYTPYRYDMVKASGVAEEAPVPTVITPGEVDVSAYVSVSYEIE